MSSLNKGTVTRLNSLATPEPAKFAVDTGDLGSLSANATTYAAGGPVDTGDLGSEKANVAATKSASAGRFLENIIPNPLSNFANYNVLWTMAVLTPKQFNNPEFYRNAVGLSFGLFEYTAGTGDIEPGTGNESTISLKSGIVFSSAGRDTLDLGQSSRVNTAFGTPEYFINKFEMNSVISANTKTGNQNAISFTFEIYEPYSMGLLLQSLQNAAAKAGYTNYLDSPFLLKMDIMGNDEDGTTKSSVRPKYFIIRLKKAEFTVNETGSVYNMEAYPYNHQGFADTVDTTFTDINISVTTDSKADPSLSADERGTVRDLLATGKNSLVALLNKQEQKNVEEGRYGIKDVYEIHFPETADKRFSTIAEAFPNDKGATQNPGGSGKKSVGGNNTETTTNKDIGQSPIAKSKFGFDVAKGGNFPFKTEKDVVDSRTNRVIRGIMQIDEKARSFHFTQGQKLSDIITQVILSSTWAKQQVTKDSDSRGMKDWFKIDVQVELLAYDEKVGDWAKKYIFRVVPFKVHSTVFDNPNSVPAGYDNIERTIAKKYDYIYTGQNTEVLDFDITLNYLFFTGIQPRPEDQTKNVVTNNQQGTVKGKNTKYGVNDSKQSIAQAANTGKTKLKRTPNLLSTMRGGSGSTDIEQKIAENFYDAFINLSSTDLVNVEMTIMGDPYWMIDSGLSNYFAKQSELNPMLTEDGTANYEGQDIFIYINFRTPADIDPRTGLAKFQYQDRESPFSGIYRVTKCLNVFEEGKFTQRLTAIRMRSQPQDFDGMKTRPDKGNSAMDVVVKANSVSQDISDEAGRGIVAGQITAVEGP